jgi:GPH family glycoside/pentoside/hexuronide:cation symporter
MSQHNTTAKSKVPMGQKIAFGFGMLANQMFPAALGIFMVVLVQNLGFPGWMWGIIYFFPRIFSKTTDRRDLLRRYAYGSSVLWYAYTGRE